MRERPSGAEQKLLIQVEQFPIGGAWVRVLDSRDQKPNTHFGNGKQALS